MYWPCNKPYYHLISLNLSGIWFGRFRSTIVWQKKIIGVRFVDFHGIHLRSIPVCLLFVFGIWLAETSNDSVCFIKCVSCLQAISFENFNDFRGWHSLYGTTQESKLEDVFFSIHSVISHHVYFIPRFRIQCTGKNNVRVIGILSCTFRGKNIQWNDFGFIPLLFHGMLDFLFVIHTAGILFPIEISHLRTAQNAR